MNNIIMTKNKSTNKITSYNYMYDVILYLLKISYLLHKNSIEYIMLL